MKIPIEVYNDRILNLIGKGGITLWPWIIMRESYLHPKNKKRREQVIRHETIHIKQQQELLVLPFYVLYLLNYILNIITFNGNPYKNICFEREGYENRDDLNYLKTRKFWAWTKYIIVKKKK